MVFLHDIPLDEALHLWRNSLTEANLGGVLGKEFIPLDESALGRTLAASLFAVLSSPHYHASAMDGFAVRSKDTRGASPTQPVVLRLPEQVKYCDTGDPLEAEFDCVIPIENAEALNVDGEISAGLRDPVEIRIRAAMVPWQHVRPMGEDMVATEMVLPAGHILRPVDLGAAAACGHSKVEVSRSPRVAIVPTGSELVKIGEDIAEGRIIDSNSVMLSAQLREWGAVVTRMDIVNDDLDLLVAALSEAARNHDLILINAGSSAGAEDFTAAVVRQLGTLLVHGVAVRPGHPVILGMINQDGRNTPVVGVPGYPVSAALTLEIFVEPVIAGWLGRKANQLEEVEAKLTRKVSSPPGDDDFLRVSLGWVNENLLATPLARGAGVITSLVKADGLAVLRRGIQGHARGEQVTVRLLKPMHEIRRTILAVGSHDLILDLIAEGLSGRDRRLVSASVGSQAGLIAVGRGEAHLAGSHLLDPETGEYNLSFVTRYAPGRPVCVVGLVYRSQGLMLAKGNPHQISDLRGLSTKGIRYVNRQRGSGTRVLLDFHLRQLAIDGSKIDGYEREEFTHLAVAAAIASGRADAGLGIEAAARALNLDFQPLFNERYDIIVRKEMREGMLLAPLWELLTAPAFKAKVGALPGYDPEPMGMLIAEVG